MNEDFDVYFWDEVYDVKFVEEGGVDILFVFIVEEIYLIELVIKLYVIKCVFVFDGVDCEGYFDGVVMVLMKLFYLVNLDNVYFG